MRRGGKRQKANYSIISLRRHYPYQVKGFDLGHLSLAAPLTIVFYAVIVARSFRFVNTLFEKNSEMICHAREQSIALNG